MRYDASTVAAVLQGVDEIWAMKGKKVTHLRLRADTPSTDAVHAAILGPFGTLRAPALRTGRTLLVGFDEATYARLLG